MRYHVHEDCVKAIKKLGEYLVFTSKHAVAAFISNAEAGSYSIPLKKIYCLSGETRKAVERLNQKEIVGVADNASELVALIIRQKRANYIDFICGEQRRDELPAQLKKAEINVNELKLYQTVLTGKTITETYDAVMFFSPSGVGSYFQTNKLPKHAICFCIGQTTAQSVKSYTSSPTIVSEQPRQQSMINDVINYFAEQRKNIEYGNN